MNVNGRSIIIYGASGGIGSEMAKLVGKNGSCIFIQDLVGSNIKICVMGVTLCFESTRRSLIMG